LEAKPVDGERLVRLEEQIGAMRGDMQEIKASISTFLTTFASLHKDYVPREEIEKQMELESERMDKLEKAIGTNSAQIEELRQKWWERPTWLITWTFTIGGSLISGLIIGMVTGHVRVG
jgi:predicted RNase H-like nuclease (RuvC/YqgF family)